VFHSLLVQVPVLQKRIPTVETVPTAVAVPTSGSRATGRKPGGRIPAATRNAIVDVATVRVHGRDTMLREILVQVRDQIRRYGKLVTKVTKERVYG
jgi:hypothetical protein